MLACKRKDVEKWNPCFAKHLRINTFEKPPHAYVVFAQTAPFFSKHPTGGECHLIQRE
jgi:hypothetical protein